MPPGPPRKRDEERRRRNKDGIETEKVNLDELLAGEVDVPVADEDWHPIAIAWYDSLKSSGQCIWYEPSDWAMAYLIAESISRDLKPQVIGVHPETGEIQFAVIPLKGASLNAYLKAMSQLMVTEGERRKLRIELERKKAADAAAGGDKVVVPITQKRMERFS